MDLANFRSGLFTGAKAKGSTAYEVALRHASCAKTLLGGKEAWEDHPDLMLQIETEEAECLSLIGGQFISQLFRPLV
jgi:hypothetical protein